MAVCLLSARSEALSSGTRSPGSGGVQRLAPQPLGAAPVTPRGADPRGLRSRPARAPPLGAALRMLGGAAGRTGGGDLETPEGWKRRRRRRRRDARSSVGVCRTPPKPGGWASLAFALRARRPSRLPRRHPGSRCLARLAGGGRMVSARALSARVAGWRDGRVAEWRGLQRLLVEVGGSQDPDWREFL